MFTLAHLSDVHLSPLPRPTLSQLLNKRMLGYANWLRGRDQVHQRRVLDTLTADLKARQADHIAVTGDLVNLALPLEFAAARDWLATLGDAETVSVVPGNHDAYVRSDTAEGLGLWRAFMQSDPTLDLPVASGPDGFPFVRLRGPAALIGLSTAVPTPPFIAAGRLSQSQLRALPDLLRALRERNLFRILLIHHPPLSGLSAWRRGLQNCEALLSILRTHGVELVLYGHNHEQALDRLDTMTGAAALVGVPSGSAARAGHRALARYNMYEISRADKGWECVMTGRGLPSPDEPITELERRALIE